MAVQSFGGDFSQPFQFPLFISEAGCVVQWWFYCSMCIPCHLYLIGFRQNLSSRASYGFDLVAGEFPAFITGANLIMEYVLSNAAVARSFTSYAASAAGALQEDAWRVKVNSFAPGYDHIDFVAVSVVVLLTVCLCFRYHSCPGLTMP